MAGSASAKGSALRKHNHLLPVGRQWQDQHQQKGLHFASTTTYSLWEGNGRISITKAGSTLQAQSLTSCVKAMAGSASARRSALCKYNHLHAVGRQWQDQYQQKGLHFANTITYILWEGNGRISISKGICTLQAQPLTCCGERIAGSASPRGLHFASTITYLLWEGNDRISISKGICTLQVQSLTGC